MTTISNERIDTLGDVTGHIYLSHPTHGMIEQHVLSSISSWLDDIYCLTTTYLYWIGVSGIYSPIWPELTLFTVRIKLWFCTSYLASLLDKAWYDRVSIITHSWIPELMSNHSMGGLEKYYIGAVTRIFVMKILNDIKFFYGSVSNG